MQAYEPTGQVAAAAAEQAAAEQLPPSAAELQRAAQMVLLGQGSPGPVLLPGALTHGLVADLQQALDAALQSQAVIAKHQGSSVVKARLLGLVAAALLGHAQAELQEPAALKAAGTRLQKLCKDLQSKKGALQHSARMAKINTKSRHKGSVAELEALLAQIERDAADGVAALRGRPAACPFQGKGRAAAPPPVSSAVALVEGPRVTAGMEDAAALLTGLAAAPAAPADVAAASRAWSCPRCSELLTEKAEACEAAAVAKQAQYTAEHQRSAAYLDLQVARQEVRARVAALEAEQERALEEREASHAQALRAARAEAAAAQSLAEERRREVVQTKHHQSTLSINAFQGVEAERKAKAARERALGALKRREAELEAERQLAEERRAATEQQHAERVACLEAALQQAAQQAADAAMQHGEQIAALEGKLRSAETRRGIAERKAAAAEQQARGTPLREANGSREEVLTGYGRSTVAGLKEQLRTKERHISDRDALLRERELGLARARVETALLAREFKGIDAKVGSPDCFQVRPWRTSRNALAPLLPHTMEIMRRLVDEASVSFAGAAVAVTLVWTMLFYEPIPESYIICPTSIRNAIHRLDVIDKADLKAKNLVDKAPWAFAADGGNKGVAVNVIAASVWDFSLGKPVIQPLACSNLNADQSARNCAATVIEAVKCAGLSPALCLQGESDGAMAAKNEVALVISEMHSLACAQADACLLYTSPSPRDS